MPSVSLDRLIAMVADVRTRIVLDHKLNLDSVLRFKETADSADWAVPLPSSTPGVARGALRYSYERYAGGDIWRQGTGYALLELLPRMPENASDLGFEGDIKPLVTIGAGKYVQGTTRFTYVQSQMETVGMIHYLSFVSLMMDVLNHFSKQLASLPDMDWREELYDPVAA